MKKGMGHTDETLAIFLRIIGQAILTEHLDTGRRFYAYEQHQDGTEDHQAFFDSASRNAWVEGTSGRYAVNRADLDQYQLRAALWWTDTLIG